MNKRRLLAFLGASLLAMLPLLVLAAEPATATKPAAAKTEAPKADAADTVRDFVFLGEARPVLIRLHMHVDGKPLQAAWDGCIDYLFRYLDGDGDGVLSKEEAERAPTVEQVTNGLVGLGGLGGGGMQGRGRPATTGPSMQDLDTDKDGKVTRAELAAYYSRMGFQPFQFRLSAGAPNFGGLLASYLGGSRPEPTLEAVRKSIFDHLDSNKTGKLTREDLQRAETVFLKLDEDQDEMIVPRELVAYEAANNNPLNGLLAGGFGNRRETATSTANLVPVLAAGEVPVDLVKRLKERYGKDPKADKAGIHMKDIGLDEATFRALDSDGNGALDDKELAAFARRSPDLELTMRLGTKGPGQSEVELPGGAGRAPLANRLTLRDGLGFLDMGLTRAEIRADDSEIPNIVASLLRPQVQTQFQQADKDNNGVLDAKEIQDSRFFRPLAKAIDRNGEGKITEAKVNAYLDHLAELTKLARAGCVTLEVTDQSRGLFDMLDTNRDGRLSVRELRQAPKLLAQLDHAGKGYLTMEDIPRSYRIEVKRGPVNQPPSGFGNVLVLYSTPGTQPDMARAEKGPLWFRKMDRNRDGDVSRKEFLFGDELFRLIDTDGDGLISLEEALKAEELLKKRTQEEEP